MEIIRHVIVFDAYDVDAESKFWAGFLDGYVVKDQDGKWHSVIDKHGNWVMGVQYSENHVRPDWPNGEKQQIHLDFHVIDFNYAHNRALELGAILLQETFNKNGTEGFQVYADPAGHPFCLGWGHPNVEDLAKFLKNIPD